MARKQKDVYERIADVKYQIKNYEDKISDLKSTLSKLNKEKDSLEMNRIFAFAKDNNLSYEEVIKALNMYQLGTYSSDNRELE